MREELLNYIHGLKHDLVVVEAGEEITSADTIKLFYFSVKHLLALGKTSPLEVIKNFSIIPSNNLWVTTSSTKEEELQKKFLLVNPSDSKTIFKFVSTKKDFVILGDFLDAIPKEELEKTLEKIVSSENKFVLVVNRDLYSKHELDLIKSKADVIVFLNKFESRTDAFINDVHNNFSREFRGI